MLWLSIWLGYGSGSAGRVDVECRDDSDGNGNGILEEMAITNNLSHLTC